MATYDTWGGSWGTSWAASWTREIALTADITGTIFGSNAADIQAGGKTIVITITGDTWVASGATFDAIRQDILDGIATTFSLLTVNQPVTAVVRDSDTVVTITLVADPAYDIPSTDTGTVTVPGSALTLGAPVVGTPSFEISPFAPVVVVEGGGGGGRYRRRKETKELLQAAFDLTLQEMFAAVEPLAQEEAREIVAPYEGITEAGEALPSVDWVALQADAQAARELVTLYAETMEREARELDEEDDMLVQWAQGEFR